MALINRTCERSRKRNELAIGTVTRPRTVHNGRHHYNDSRRQTPRRGRLATMIEPFLLARPQACNVRDDIAADGRTLGQVRAWRSVEHGDKSRRQRIPPWQSAGPTAVARSRNALQQIDPRRRGYTLRPTAGGHLRRDELAHTLEVGVRSDRKSTNDRRGARGANDQGRKRR